MRKVKQQNQNWFDWVLSLILIRITTGDRQGSQTVLLPDVWVEDDSRTEPALTYYEELDR